MEQERSLILVVDDDEEVLKTLYKVAKASDLDADTASSGMAALEALQQKRYDLILMDINMQGLDGFETIQEIRKKGYTTPIIIVSGRKEDFDAVYGLDVGADDYITKPFNPVTLGAKIKALIRRDKSAKSNVDQNINIGPFMYNTSSLRFYKNGQEIYLTAKENAVIKLFIDNVNRVFTKDMLYDMVWDNAVVDEKTITVYINRLRQKIEDDPSDPRYIQTVRGIGYRFVVK